MLFHQTIWRSDFDEDLFSYPPMNIVQAPAPSIYSGPSGWGYGGGLCVAGGTVILTNDSITNNEAGWSNQNGYYTGYAGGFGGGIYIASGGKVYLDSYTTVHTQNNYPSNIYREATYYRQIGSFTANPNPITAGSSLTLTASNISPPFLYWAGVTIKQVTFYYFDSRGAQHVLGNGTQTSTGVWTLTVKANLTPGTYTLDAQAEDSDGLFGPAAELALTVQ